MKNKSAGFSLVELLVVISILSLMAAVVVSGAISRSGRQREVKLTLEQLAATLEEARAGSTRGKTIFIPGNPGPNNDNSLPSEGFGVRVSMNQNKVTLFGNYGDREEMVSEWSIPDTVTLDEIIYYQTELGVNPEQLAKPVCTFVFAPLSGELRVNELPEGDYSRVFLHADNIHDDTIDYYLHVYFNSPNIFVSDEQT